MLTSLRVAGVIAALAAGAGVALFFISSGGAGPVWWNLTFGLVFLVLFILIVTWLVTEFRNRRRRARSLRRG